MQPAAHAALLAALVPLTGCGSDAIGASEQRAAVTALLATQAAALGVELVGLDEQDVRRLHLVSAPGTARGRGRRPIEATRRLVRRSTTTRHDNVAAWHARGHRPIPRAPGNDARYDPHRSTIRRGRPPREPRP